jgi:3-hydroxybutyryl-CoA dehydratase
VTVVYSDISVGDRYTSAGRTVTEADIMAFAGVSGDFNRLHTDDEWVRRETTYDGRIAHGLLVLSITSGLRTPVLDDYHVLGYLHVARSMKAPTYPGDTITAHHVVSSVRPSRSRPGSGVVTLDVEVVKTDGTVVQAGQDVLMVGGSDD